MSASAITVQETIANQQTQIDWLIERNKAMQAHIDELQDRHNRLRDSVRSVRVGLTRRDLDCYRGDDDD